jgi:hypothetical protein
MRRVAEYLYCILITLWVGALWTVGGLVAPTLFHMLDDRALAGRVAGQLFAYVGWLGIGAAAYLLVFVALRKNAAAFKCSVFWLAFAMLLLTVAGSFGIQPILAQLKADSLPREVMEGALRDRFMVWHGVSSVVFLIESLLGLLLVTGQARALR